MIYVRLVLGILSVTVFVTILSSNFGVKDEFEMSVDIPFVLQLQDRYLDAPTHMNCKRLSLVFTHRNDH